MRSEQEIRERLNELERMTYACMDEAGLRQYQMRAAVLRWVLDEECPCCGARKANA